MARIKKFFSPELRHYEYDLNKRWRVEYFTTDKRVVIYGNINKFCTIEERKSAANKIINENLQKHTDPDFVEDTLQQMALYLKPKTINSYRSKIEKLREFAPNLATVTTPVFISFLGKLKEAGASNTTINNYWLQIHSIYEHAKEQGRILNNPIEKIKRVKSDPVSLGYFNQKQIDLLRPELAKNPQLDLAVKMLYYCFIRPGELRQMKISDINFDAGIIQIRSEISKNKKTQIVSIPEHFRPDLERLKDFHNNFYILSKSGAPGASMIAQNYLNNQHAKILDKLKIRGRYAFYSWKHTGAVRAVKSGINIKDLQLQLRHHSLDMVNEYLKNLGVTDSEDLRNRFPAL